MKVGIYTIEKTLFEGEAVEVIAKTTTGEISVLQNHIPLITRLAAGPFRIKDTAGHEKIIELASGYMEIQPENTIVVLVDTV